MLELRNKNGDRMLTMSQQAYNSLDKKQQRKLRDNGSIITTAIDDIENSAGGSVRCMLAEVHLPRARG